MKTATEVLDCMDEFFSDESKWVKGQWVKFDKSLNVVACCYIGAVSHCARHDGHLQLEVETLTREVLSNTAAISGGSTPIASWNDRPDTTFDDIKRTIKEARALSVAS